MSTIIDQHVKNANNNSNGRWSILSSSVDPTLHVATFLPPRTSIYYRGIFFAELTVPTGYPLYPPRVKMSTKIFHPNFSQLEGHEGCMYVEKLYSDYQMTFTIEELMEYMWNLFFEPDPDNLSQCNPEASHLYKTDRAEFERIAQDWTKRFAC